MGAGHGGHVYQRMTVARGPAIPKHAIPLPAVGPHAHVELTSKGTLIAFPGPVVSVDTGLDVLVVHVGGPVQGSALQLQNTCLR